MLIKDVAQEYNGQVRFVSENWGDSKLAERFGVKKYPVVFVEEVLVARPNDFGWLGEKGRYTPWRDPANHEKFKKDLSRMINLALKDRGELAKYQATSDEAELAALPKFAARNLEGKSIESAGLSGQVVVVEFWATWCPPCRSTLNWLGEVERRYGDKVTVLAIAVESKEPEVREMARPLSRQVQVVLASDELITSFGNLTSIPTLYVFDGQGKLASAFYGAPADLHQKVGRAIDSLLKQKGPR